MKPSVHAGKNRPAPAWSATNSASPISARDVFAILFGAMLGLAILKFGNPVILDSVIPAPRSPAEAWSEPWPPHWAFWCGLPVMFFGICLAVIERVRWPGSRWLWLLPLTWLGWQCVAAGRTVDGALTSLALVHFVGCVASYFAGAWLLADRRRFHFLLAGLLVALVICLLRATEQKLFEFPEGKQMLIEGERTGWTNFPPTVIQDMKATRMIITTNGVDIANPLLLAKFDKGRVHGTMVYPNALAGVVLLLLPVLLVLAVDGTRRFRPLTRKLAIALVLFLGGGSLFWTGSKSGWLIALGLLGVWFFRLSWSPRMKWTALVVLLAGGAAVFAVRFHHYFASGATSVGARFDYWHAAVQNTREHPLFGSGPGTFQRPYALLKRPESEMARLAHNDYLEQFSDSGMVGGLAYAAWIAFLLAVVLRRTWRESSPALFAVALGVLGFFLQGVSEFGLYIPALAWTAFGLAGALLAVTAPRTSPPAA